MINVQYSFQADSISTGPQTLSAAVNSSSSSEEGKVVGGSSSEKNSSQTEPAAAVGQYLSSETSASKGDFVPASSPARKSSDCNFGCGESAREKSNFSTINYMRDFGQESFNIIIGGVLVFVGIGIAWLALQAKQCISACFRCLRGRGGGGGGGGGGEE